jgi:hypothetical protein
MDIDVNGLLERSFPAPGSEGEIRRMFEDSVAATPSASIPAATAGGWVSPTRTSS